MTPYFSEGTLFRPMLPYQSCQGKNSVNTMSTIHQTSVSQPVGHGVLLVGCQNCLILLKIRISDTNFISIVKGNLINFKSIYK